MVCNKVLLHFLQYMNDETKYYRRNSFCQFYYQFQPPEWNLKINTIRSLGNDIKFVALIVQAFNLNVILNNPESSMDGVLVTFSSAVLYTT